jgi:O-glycosyl hydrolase
MIRVDISKRYQTVQGFGALVPPHSQAASAVYTDRFLEMLVKDLGCSVVRTLFLRQEGDTPDATALERQISDLSRMRNHRPDLKIIATVTAPPGVMRADDGSLKSDSAGAFAQYLMDMCATFEGSGCPVYALSLQNGPTTNPTIGFSRDFKLSCAYDAQSYFNVFKALAVEKERRGSSVKLIASDDSMFVIPRVCNFVGKIVSDESVSANLGILGAHGYIPANWEALMALRATLPVAKLPDLYAAANADFKRSVEEYGRDTWLFEDCGEQAIWKDNIDYSLVVTPRESQYFVPFPMAAIDLALKIRAALVNGNVAAYVYWLSTTMENNEEGADYGNDAEQALCLKGTPTCKYQAAKHFFSYVEPGMVRVGADSVDTLSCAFESEGKTVAVVINNLDDIVDTSIEFVGSTAASYTSYTSVENDYHRQESGSLSGGRSDVTLLPNSITTFVVE